MDDAIESKIADVDTQAQPVRVGACGNVRAANEYVLLAASLGRHCWIQPELRVFALYCDPQNVRVLTEEFARYERERLLRSKHAVSKTTTFRAGFVLPVIFLAMLVGTFVAQASGLIETRDFANSSAGLWRDGQWWRPFTALFLHANVAHLIGNLLIGGTLCILVAKSVGRRGWLWILVAATIANAVNAWLHRHAPFASIGFSTASFAALGVLVGIRMLGDRLSPRNHRAIPLAFLFVPLGAGVALLGWFGAGSSDSVHTTTDVGAHVLGFVCGIVVALTARRNRATN